MIEKKRSINLFILLLTLFIQGCSLSSSKHYSGYEICHHPYNDYDNLTPFLAAEYCLNSFSLNAGSSDLVCQGNQSCYKFKEPIFKRYWNNPYVLRKFEYFTSKGRSFVRSGLENKKKYFEIMASEFFSQGLSVELLNVAFIESRYIPDAKSHAGAVGMWQFIKSTAKAMGLKVGLFKDERKDPLKSTRAAGKYLKRLYKRFNDWPLALAAYNAGPGRISQLLRANGTSSYFELVRRGVLPKETAEFVPKIIALSIINSNPKRYGF